MGMDIDKKIPDIRSAMGIQEGRIFGDYLREQRAAAECKAFV